MIYLSISPMLYQLQLRIYLPTTFSPNQDSFRTKQVASLVNNSWSCSIPNASTQKTNMQKHLLNMQDAFSQNQCLKTFWDGPRHDWYRKTTILTSSTALQHICMHTLQILQCNITSPSSSSAPHMHFAILKEVRSALMPETCVEVYLSTTYTNFLLFNDRN